MGLRGAFRWFARNVRESNAHDPVTMDLERNREAAVEMGAENPPDMPLYSFRLGLRAGFSGQERASIPVFRRVNPHPHPVLKEIYYCEVAGSMLEAANVHALREKVARMLETIAPAKTLPLAYFRVPAMDYSLPVYEEGGRIVSPVLAGPKLKADDLATMRRHACRYLENAGYVSDESQVEVRVLRPSDLSLVPPAALIRSLEDPDLWLATVEGDSAEGLVVGVLGEATELRAEERRRPGAQVLNAPPAASDITSLLRLVANELAQANRIADPFSLYARQVRPEIWARTEQVTDDVGRRLSCWLEAEEPTKLELPLRRTAAGEMVTALDDQGICVLLGGDEPTLAQKVGQYLSKYGFLRWEDSVEVLAEPASDRSQSFAGTPEIEFSRLEFEPSSQSHVSHTEEEALDGQTQQEEVRRQ
jgi:hypothetical protein